jgi:hypothetical protein
MFVSNHRIYLHFNSPSMPLCASEERQFKLFLLPHILKGAFYPDLAALNVGVESPTGTSDRCRGISLSVTVLRPEVAP